MKKAFVTFGVLIITLLCSISVFAMDTDDSGMWEYQTYGTGIELAKYNGTQTDVYVPSKITKGDAEYSVIKLGDNLFKDNTALNSATLGEGITEIGASAFEGATNLVCIVTPESLAKIGTKAFSGCTNFNSVILYDAVINIGENAFSSCDKLTIYCNENTAGYTYAVNNNITYKILNSNATPEIYMVDGVEYYIMNGEAYAVSFDESTSTVTIPTTVNGYPVTELKNVFNDCRSLTNITLPKSLQTIGDKEFYNCRSLASLIIPDSVTSIGNEAFYNCYSLLSIEIPNNVTYIGSSAFRSCAALTSIEIPNAVKKISYEMFRDCGKLRDIKIPNSVTSIGTDAFYNCTNLTNIEIPNSVTAISFDAFSGCTGLTTAVIPTSVKDIYYDSFPENTIWLVYENSYAHTFAVNKNLLHFVIKENATPKIYTVDGVTYFISGSEAIAISFDKSTEYVTIPEMVEGYPVTNLRKVFKGCTSLISITLPGSLKIINSDEFYNCSNLKSVEMSNGVTHIGSNAFFGCTRLGSIKIPNSVTAIGGFAFKNSGLGSIEIPNSVTSIGGAAFFQSNLSSIEIPDSVTYIGDSAFAYCRDLSRVKISSGVKYIYSQTFYRCNNLSSIEIPDSVTYIGDSAFSGCSNLKSLNLPNSVTSIGGSAFSGCSNLKSLNLPNGVTSIGSSAFSSCTLLPTIVIPRSIKNIYSNSFANNTVWLVYEDSIAHTVAVENNLLYFIMEENTTPEIYTVDGVTYFISDGKALAISFDKSTTKVTIPSTVEGYPVTELRGTFSNCTSLTSVILPEGLKIIGDNTFSSCGIMSIKIPSSVTSIGSGAFRYCRNLTSIEIPSSITSIENYTFMGCENLTTIKIPSSVTSIGGGAFRYCYSLTSIEIPNSVTNIGVEVFSDCYSLTSIEIPNSVTSIGQSAFYRCSRLINIEIPNTVTIIESSTFAYCGNLRSIEIPNSVTSIGQSAFYECSNLRNIGIPSSVTYIDSQTFYGCSNLRNIEIPSSVTYIDSQAFYGCSSLNMVFIPESVKTIYISAFDENIILLVYENSYTHTIAVANNLLHFVLHKTSNPEISYGRSIEGTVTYTNGTAVADATVEILYDDGTLKESVTTDANGNYEFTYAEVGRYTICVTDADGNTANEVVSVKRMNVFDVYLAGETDLVLKKGYNVSGIVSPDAAKVTISDTSGNIIKSIDTTNGTFTFGDVPRGSYMVKAENKTGSVTTEIYVSNEDVTGISLEIQAHSATITGDTKIENRDGTFTAKIWVNIDLIDANGNVVASTKTDAEGKYTFENLPLGSYNIVATTTEMRSAYTGNFDKNFELKGYGHVDVTEFVEYAVGTIILREDKVNLTSVSGKVTANGTTQDCQVILTNENGDQIAVFITDNNGKYSFVNIPDGMYSITAITKVDGMGFAVITIKDGIVYGDTDIKVAKADKISKREETLLAIPDCSTKQEALLYKEAVLTEKAFYDSLSEKERKQLSEEWIEKLFKLIDLISNSNINATDGVIVENVESVISSDEIDEAIAFSITVTETTATDAGEDGITTDKEYETEKIKDKKGKNKNIAKYYDITFSKDGQNISNIQKQTETNGKLRITMDIPEEYRGHKHYSFIHMHKGEAVTLVDLDDNPNTVTFEIDKFSTFALAYSDVELVGEIEDKTYPASITYDESTGKISVSSTETGKLHIATYDGKRFLNVVSYDVFANAPAIEYSISSNQAAFVWDANMSPLCKNFIIED